MSRWSQAYKARYPLADTVDTVDTVQSVEVVRPYTVNSVNSVNSVIRQKPENDPASDAAFLATERAAIVAESLLGDATATSPHMLPVSWSDPRIEPTPGACCHCCRGNRWWSDTAPSSGWRCAVCHPPAHLTAGQFHEIKT